MRRHAVLLLPFLLLFFTGCADGTTAPEIDLIAAQGKPAKPPKTVDLAKPEISFAAGTVGNRTLWVMDGDGGNSTAVYSGGYMMYSSWSDQGAGTTADPYVILVSQAGSAPQALDKLELVVDEGGPRVQNIINLAEESVYFGATVRPGGAQFVAVDVYDPLGNSFVLGDMDTGGALFLYRPAGGRALMAPAWNPDGTRLAFFEIPESPGGIVDLRILNMDLPPEDPDRIETSFTFSQVDGNPISLSWNRTSNLNDLSSNELLFSVDGVLYRVNLASPALDDPVEDGYQAVWSPDDSKIVYLDSGRLFLKTFGARKDKRLPGGTNPDWRRNPLQ